MSMMSGSQLRRLLVLCCLFWTISPVFGESPANFLQLMVDPSTVRLEAELRYTGPEDQASLEQAAQRDLGEAFTISIASGPKLKGQLKEVRLGQATRRSELSGEAESEDPKNKSLYAVWEYPQTADSGELHFHSEMEKPASFVTRHRGVRLHDVAPLKARQVLQLDGDDPWYSRFLQPELPRTPQDSIACYLYLEPAQTRLEVLARARDLQPLGSLELGSDPTLSETTKAELSKNVGEILDGKLGLKVNDRPLDFRLEKVEFVKRTPTSADSVKPTDPVPTQSATLGAVFLGPAITEKGKLKLRCELFGPRIKKIPAFLIQGDSVKELELLPDAEAEITIEAPPELKTLTPVSAPPNTAKGLVLALASAGLILGAVLMLGDKDKGKVFFTGMILWVLTGLGALKWGLASDDAEPKAPLQSLLENIYQAFEAPTEEAVYDQLAVSVDGELLSEVYLQTRKGLEAEQGVQVVVERVKVKSAKVSSRDWWGDGVKLKGFWEVSGRVGHWGHEHERTNWYNAELKLKSVDGNWKLTELEILDETRI